MASGRLADYLGQGTASLRPASLDLQPDTIGLWLSTDTGELDFWDGTEWAPFNPAVHLAGLADVDTTGLEDGMIIYWNEAAGKFKFEAVPNAGIPDVPDATLSVRHNGAWVALPVYPDTSEFITDAPDGDSYFRKAGAWVKYVAPAPAPSALVELTDYDDSTPATNGQVPTWDNTASKWKPKTPTGGGGGTASAVTNRGAAAHSWWRVWMPHGYGYFAYALASLEFRATPGGADQCVGGTPYASPALTENPGSNIFDHDPSTYAATANSGTGQIMAQDCGFGYQFASPVKVGEVLIQARSDGTASTQTAPLGEIQYSDDGVDWYTAFEYRKDTAFAPGEARVFANPNIAQAVGTSSKKQARVVLTTRNPQPADGDSNMFGAGLQQVVFDTGNFWDPVNYNFKIPVGVSKVRIDLGYSQEGSSGTGTRIKKNGVNVQLGGNNSSKFNAATSGVLDVVPGDAIQVGAYFQGGGVYGVSGSAEKWTWATISDETNIELSGSLPWDFSPPLSANFTKQGTGTTAILDDPDAGMQMRYKRGTGAGTDSHVVWTTLIANPAGDWTFTAKIKSIQMYTNSTPSYAGLVLESTDGSKVMDWGIDFRSATATLYKGLFNLPTGFQGSEVQISLTGAAFEWYRIVHNAAAATLSYQVSPDGKQWAEVVNVADTEGFGAVPGRVGFGFRTNAGPAGMDMLLTIPYFKLS